jgi:hypothetical protein
VTASSIDQLIEAGFKNVGPWQLDPVIGPKFVGQIPKDAGVYVFVVNDQVCYVGCAQRGLHKRFLKYKSRKNKGAVAVRLRAYIAKALASGAEVSVYVMTPPSRSVHDPGQKLGVTAGTLPSATFSTTSTQQRHRPTSHVAVAKPLPASFRMPI